MKKFFGMLIIIAVLLLASCSASVSYSLSDENSVEAYYLITFPSDTDLKKYTDSIKKYWESKGLDVQQNTSQDGITITGNNKNDFDSRQIAAEALSAILTDRNSIFYNVKFDYTPSYFKDGYSLTASVSLSDIIRQSEGQQIPQSELESLLGEADKGEYSLSVSLPGNIISTNADADDNGVCTWNIKFGETREISVQTEKEFSDKITEYSDLQNASRRDDSMIVICAVAGAIVLIAIILVLILRKKR